jgi:hypothetical protein
LNGIFDFVEASESGGHSVGWVGSICGCELELVNSLILDNVGPCLDGLGKHETRIKGVLEHVRIFLLFVVLVVFLDLCECDGISLFNHGIFLSLGFEFLPNLVSLDVILHFGDLVLGLEISVLFVEDVVLVHDEVVVLGFVFLFLFNDLLLLELSFFLHILDGKIAEISHICDLSLVFSAELAEFLILLSSEFVKFGVDAHLDHFSVLVHLFAEICLHILEERGRGDEDFRNLDSLKVNTPALADFLEVFLDGNDD